MKLTVAMSLILFVFCGSMAAYEGYDAFSNPEMNFQVRQLRVPANQEYCAVYKVDKDHPATENHAGGEFSGDPEYSMACSKAPDPNTI